ncbi:hypothetical protein PAEPH01_1123 [Pancytospora epiphaga]|nr:hypothetical protein PAEPH01_1123 [Pancytospora epiphaga]
MANRKSKRISKGKQMKASRKVRDGFRKKQKQERKNSSKKIDVPKSFLLSEAEKEQIQFIKEQTEQRTLEYNKTIEILDDIPKYISELEDALSVADAAVEVLDYRDITHSRSIKCEEIVKKHGKRLYFYLSHYNEAFNVDIKILEEVGHVITDMKVLETYKNICIFGNAKSGKFTFIKLIEEVGINPVCVRVTTPIEKPSPSMILRGVSNSVRIDPLAWFSEIFQFMNPLSLADYYKIRPVSEMNELLKLLGEVYSAENRERKTICAGILHILKDIQAGKIPWVCTGDQYVFEFIR